ncbi:helix-turn-helix DNA binding protein [Gordonia phage ClubL]|uniref:Helix-turn-helix DNA binding protein n=1 Tax=Gordonia phage ClubL TaxID=1838065 RepID=A0A160DFC3_9CAUD|nr:helix-turn-helix DNA binding protein [Gordonia phage ClubL]ANA86601.1 helix-turn-helix DNA binding protein [Gordonia phage ClubL]QYC53588.1 helix-turn-helix DNA-binding domain protein [Gordonia phage Norvs]
MTTQTQETKYGVRLSGLREAHNMTAEEASARMGWEPSKWGQIESSQGDFIEHTQDMVAVARDFGVDEAYLRPKLPKRWMVNTKHGKPITIVKRLNALRDAGWTESDIAEATYMPLDQLRDVRHRVETLALNHNMNRSASTKNIEAELVIRFLENTPDISTHDADELVPATSVRAHMLALEDVGYSRLTYTHRGPDRDGIFLQMVSFNHHVAQALSKPNADHILVRNDIAQEVLSLPTDVNAHIPSSLGATRRAQALVAWGYDPSQIRREAGLTADQLHRILWTDCSAPLDRNDGVNLVRTFSKLEHIPGRSKNSIDLAKRNGWPLPFQWDEYTIDRAQTKPCKGREIVNTIDLDNMERRTEVLNKEFEELLQTLDKVA